MSEQLKKMLGSMVFLVMLGGAAMGAEESTEPVTCSLLRRASVKERLMFILGYTRGATVAAVYAKPEEDSARTILMHVYPLDYRAGAILLELDVWCDRAENRQKPVDDIMLDIAKEKNAALIKQHNDAETARAVERLLRELKSRSP